MSVPASRRGFLRGLTTLPLIGGGVALIGAPSAVAAPITRDLVDSYDAWLFYERRRLKAEKIGRGFDWDAPGQEDALEVALSYVPIANAGARYHCERRVPPAAPSTRAALVLATVGVDWREGVR